MPGTKITEPFEKISEPASSRSLSVMRFLPMLAGTLLPLIIFGICRYLKFGNTASLLAGLMVIFENSLLVQSRFILIDPFLLLFGFSSLLTYLAYREKRNWKLFLLAAICAALTINIKWTGLTFPFLIVLMELYRVWKNKSEWKGFIKRGLIFTCITAVIYIGSFAIHFALLSNPGPGDAFMKSSFQSEPFFQKFTELNTEMFQANRRLTAEHSYGSKWYTWPVMYRGVYYWQHSTENEEARIYFLGNPIQRCFTFHYRWLWCKFPAVYSYRSGNVFVSLYGCSHFCHYSVSIHDRSDFPHQIQKDCSRWFDYYLCSIISLFCPLKLWFITEEGPIGS
ncbi:phospholipid carrier-dependent glycosyltransferase [Candidatus Parcubacteria bacterium]|nr:phospholipid carrier-dependent glycosyltransferase [Candidatus Parcubacteria bacterium]